ncbi:MAG: caspase family protein, partial [Pseudomonadota bacterium]
MVTVLRLLLVAALSFGLALIHSGQAWAAGRLALVIGNADYGSVGDLKNPLNDAADVATALERLGYEVTRHENLGRDGMVNALREFRNASLGAEHAIVYYAGHGIEVDRQNYLVPTDAALRSDLDVEFEAIPLTLVERATQGASELQLVILDACRDNPFIASMTRAIGTRSIGRGLGNVEPTGNSLIFYAARHGTVANDGVGRNSPFAAALLDAMGRPGLEIGQLFRVVRDEVRQSTQNRQEPFIYGTLSSRQVFLNKASLQITPVDPDGAPEPGPEVQNTAPPTSNNALELAFWDTIKNSRDANDYRDYLAQFPAGTFVSLAERRLRTLEPEQPAQLPSFDFTPADPVTPSEEVAALPAPEPARPMARAAEPEPSPQPEPEVTDRGVSRQQVSNVQARLNILGFEAGPVDGAAGRRTRNAIRAYQQRKGLPVTGQIDQRLLTNLRADVSNTDLVAYRERIGRPVDQFRRNNRLNGFCKRHGAEVLNRPGLPDGSPNCLRPHFQNGRIVALDWYRNGQVSRLNVSGGTAGWYTN